MKTYGNNLFNNVPQCSYADDVFYVCVAQSEQSFHEVSPEFRFPINGAPTAYDRIQRMCLIEVASKITKCHFKRLKMKSESHSCVTLYLGYKQEPRASL